MVGMAPQDLSAQRASCGVILSRQGLTQREELQHFARHGACCYIVQCDIAHSLETDNVMGWIHEHLPIVGNIVHAAGLLGYGNIIDMTSSNFWQLAMPKVSSIVQSDTPFAKLQHRTLQLTAQVRYIIMHRLLEAC